jgi:alpha-D-ribose 1-methylphosphonate 5-triphosphate diphosphatase PhnM
LKLDVSNDDVASEATKKYDGELNAQKHQEKTTTEEPEQSDETVDNSIPELTEFDEQKLEQPEYPDVVVDASEHPMVLDEDQAVATTSMTTVDTRKVDKSLRLD